jgi:hypothetical protein
VASLGAARLTYEEFYRALGTTVDDVGLSPWRMVAASAMALLAVAPNAWVAVYVAVAVGRGSSPAMVRFWRGLTFGVLVVVLLLVAQGPLYDGVWLPISAALGVALVFLALAPPALLKRREQLRLSFRWFLVAGTTTTLLFWAFAWAAAGDSARGIRGDGTRPEGASVILDVALRRVCVAPVGVPVAQWPSDVPISRPLVLLGVSSAQMVLRDVGASRTATVPSSAAVTMTAASDRC